MEAAEVDRLRPTVAAAIYRLRTLRNVARDTLVACAELQNDLAAIAADLGLSLEGTHEGTAQEAQPDEYHNGKSSRYVRDGRCVV